MGKKIGVNNTEEETDPVVEQAMNNIMVVKLSNHKIPEFCESRNPSKPWTSYGEKNDYPDYLFELFCRSSYHNAIIGGKVDFIFGQGFMINKAACASTGIEALVQKRLETGNRYEKLNDVMSRCALDLEISGGFYLQIIYKKLIRKGQQVIISEICHIDFTKMRSNKNNTEFYYSEDWSAYNQSLEKTGYRAFKPFDPTQPKQGTQILYFKEYRPKLKTYPLPGYIGCIPYIESDYEIGNFHLNNIKNSFWGSFLINFYNGMPSDEQKKVISEQIRRKYTGTDNAGKFILNFSDDKNKGADMQALNPPQLDKQFTTVENTIQQQIFTGHKITSGMLFGIKTAGQLGGRDEIIEAATLFQNLYVSGKQQKLERVFNELLAVDGLPECLKIQPIQAIQIAFKDTVLAEALTKDEIRITSGYEPLNIPGVSDKLPPQPTVSMPKITARSEKVYLRTPQTEIGMTALVKMFSDRGVPAKDYEVLRHQELRFGKADNIILSEAQLWATRFAVAVDVDVSDNQSRILGILKNNPLATIEDIAKALKMSPRVAQENLDKLTNANLIEPNQGGGFDLSDSGVNHVAIDEPITMDFEIKYKYQVKAGYGPALIKTSRPFCVSLIDLDLLYSAQQLAEISEESGYDVLRFKGGPYRKPGSDYVSDECRHTWARVVVKKIRKAA